MWKQEHMQWIKPPKNLTLRSPYVRARLLRSLSRNSLQFQLQTDRGPVKITLPADCSFEAAQQKDYEDMCEMDVLNQPQVLSNIIRRYLKQDIFTSIGSTLIALNPYRRIDRMFDGSILQQARQMTLSGKISNGSPHVYKFAGRAFQTMKLNGGRQALVISGESGAGKTESTKYCLQLLTSLSSKKTHSIQQKILAANPVLQAFGNSKTVRNENSSRFGKFMKIYFGEEEHIIGADIQSYLLEKSRVVALSPNQRSFHAFYALSLSGKFQAKEPQHYHLLKQSGCYSSTHIDDGKYFDQINNAFREIGFKQEDIDKIWMVLLVILDLSNVDFDETAHIANQSKPCLLVGINQFQKIASILKVQASQLEKMLVYQKRKFLKQYAYISYGKQGAKANKQALSKALYQSLFQFILKGVQIGIKPACSINQNRSINILDIFGFQNFAQNSFEQFCINYTNERLFRLYNDYVFQKQMDMLREDGLQKHLGGLVPPSNENLITIISGKLSLFSICNDMALVQFKDEDIINGFRKLQSPILTFDKLKPQEFALAHSPCSVNYIITGFKAKNQDRVNQDILELIGNLWSENRKEVVGKTILGKFSKQIDDLMTQLQSSQVHFMRCIKPNQIKAPDSPDDNYILTQVRYLGVLQTIFIRKNIFPARKTYQQFKRQYCIIFKSLYKEDTSKDIFQQIFYKIQAKKGEFLLGKQRIYMNCQVQQKITRLFYQALRIREEKSLVIQRAMKIWTFKRKTFRNLTIFIKRLKILKTLPQSFELKLLKTGFIGLIQHRKRQLIRIARQRQEAKLAALWQAQQIKEQELLKNISTINQPHLLENSVNNSIDTSINKSQSFSGLRQGMKHKQHHEKRGLPKGHGLTMILNETDEVSENAIDPRSPYLKVQTPSNQLMGKSLTFNQQYLQSLNQSYSSNFQGSNEAFGGQFDIGMYDKKQSQLQTLRSVLSQKYSINVEGNQEDLFSPLSSHCSFKIANVPMDLLNQIIDFKVEEYFNKILRRRTTFFGFDKTYKQILVHKKNILSKSMTVLIKEEEQKIALSTFKLIIKISEEVKIQKVLQCIQELLEICQNITISMKTEVMVQFIRQCNTSYQLCAVRIYQALAVFVHVFSPSQQIIKACLHLFYWKLKEKKIGASERQYLLYLFSTLLTNLKKKTRIGYLPISYQIMGLMCKRQISIPVFLSTGNSIFVNVQSFNSFFDLKTQCLQKFGISSRFPSELFAFFEVVNFDNEELEESPIRETNMVWDMMTYWQLTKEKYLQTGINPPNFFLVFKLRYAITVRQEDEQAIELCFSQLYFDYFMGKIYVEPPLTYILGAHIHKIKFSQKNIDDAVMGLLPLSFMKDRKKEEATNHLKMAAHDLSIYELGMVQLKYRFIKICSQCSLGMSVEIPTQDQVRIFLKPRFIYLMRKNDPMNYIQAISLKKLIKWEIDKEYFKFEVAGGPNSENKNYYITTDCSSICNEFLRGLSTIKLIKNDVKIPSFKKK